MGFEWMVIVPTLITFAVWISKSHEAKRVKAIARAHTAKDGDIEAGYRAVAESMKQLRAAKNNEQNVLATNWVNEWNSIAPSKEHRWNIPQNAAITEAPSKEIRQNAQYPNAKEYWKRPARDTPDDWSYSDRLIQSAGAFVRQAPSDRAHYYGTMGGNERVHFDGWVYGKSVNGNDIWFLYFGEHSRRPKYVWSGATSNPSTTGMQDMNDYKTEFIKDGRGETIAVHVAPDNPFPRAEWIL